MDIHCISMRKIGRKLILEPVRLYFEKRVTRFGNSAKVDCPKKYIGKRAIVVIEDES